MTMRRTLLLGFGLLAFAIPAAQSQEPTAAAKRDQQKRANAAVEQTARFVTTSLRTIVYQKLDAKDEQDLLDEVAGGLRQLSQEDMKAVLDHLERAAKAGDEATADAEQRAAAVKHKAVVATLRSMLFKLDILRTLEEAAKRLQDQAKREFALHQRALELHERPAPTGSRDGRTMAALLKESVEQQADAQSDLQLELANLLKQLSTLKPKLNAEQAGRLDKADVFGRGGQLVIQMEQAQREMTTRNFRRTAEIQLPISKELQAMAAALIPPRDRLTALKEIRDKIEQVRKAQEAVKDETKSAKDLQKANEARRTTTEKVKDEQNRVANQKLAEQQGHIEFDTREARKELEALSKEMAAKLNPPEGEMRKAQEELRNRKPEAAAKPQETAAQQLKVVRDQIDKEIAAAELAKNDPLTATKKAIEAIDKLINDQHMAKNQTKDAVNKADALKAAAEKQTEVAKKADDLTTMPLPANDEAKAALAKAAEKADAAKDDLSNKDPKAAQPKQDEVIKELHAAKKALEEQAKAIQKRRDDLAKLEAAKDKLDQLAKAETEVAEAAAEAAKAAEGDKPDLKPLAEAQDKLTPPTKAVQEMLKDAAPNAAKKVEEAGKNQMDAKKDLANNDAAKGAEEAKEAAKNLNEAKDEVAKKIEELKGKDIADQAALQPNRVDPVEAANQLAKALEEANKAAENAKAAADQADAKPAGDMPPAADKSVGEKLAALQKDLAAKAEKAANPEAAKTAGEAAKALEQGDLATAKGEQKKALSALKSEAAKPAGEASPNAELAKDQQKLIDAVEALEKSAEANAAAQAALAQAQAAAPTAVKPQLDAAAKQLDAAAKDLAEGKPAEAGMAQTEAAEKLGEALGTLNAAAKAMGQQPAEPGKGQTAKSQPGNKPGDKPGKPAPNPMPGQQTPKDPAEGTGDRKEFGSAADVKPSGTAANAAGNFINLQKLERDKVQQSAEAAFPAEFRELIKQYNINIKKNAKPQPAAAPLK